MEEADLVIKTNEVNGGEGIKRARKRRCIGTEEEGKGAVELSGSFSAQFAWPATLFPGGFFLHLWQVFDKVFKVSKGLLSCKSPINNIASRNFSLASLSLKCDL